MTGYIETVLNEAAIRNGNLDFINPPVGFFPADCFGSRAAKDIGKVIGLRVNGELVETDIRQKSSSVVSPRKRFGSLFQHTFHARPGDKVRLVRLGERDYDLQYLQANPPIGGAINPMLSNAAVTNKVAADKEGMVRTLKPVFGDEINVSVIAENMTHVPTRGLVIMEEPLRKILSGQKTMELRSKPYRHCGAIALIKKGSKKVYAVAEITDYVGPMSFEEFCNARSLHGVEGHRLQEVFDIGWVYGWLLKDVRILKTPVPYVHKGMSQVLLDHAAIREIGKQLAAT